MITEDKALAIARELLEEEVRQGGLVTLFGMTGRWEAVCTFCDGGKPVSTPKRYSIDRVDGNVTAI